jgi:hypothetical protein
LSRILASPLFSQSKHYPSLLKYVVNETLEGRIGQLKERALGVEVFGRHPDYDTNADPVVRTSACEVRKRIAQYYHEAGHEDQIRIDLPSGSYIPEFRYPATGAAPAAAPVPVLLQPAPRPRARFENLLHLPVQRKWVVVAIAASVLLSLSIGAASLGSNLTPVESFWNPVWGSGDSVMMALGGNPDAIAPNDTVRSTIGPTFAEVMRTDRLAFSDALTMARLTGLTREYGKKKLDIRRATAFSLTDLRKGPVILVGAFNNSWALRLSGGLRFSYIRDDQTHKGVIRDRDNPSNQSWVHDPTIPYSTLTQDFAVVSRFQDPLTEKMVVMVGGMGRDGTIAAGEFVTEPRYLAMLDRRAPKHWDKKNLQVLLATDIVNGNTGPPRIIATYFW